MKKCLFCRIINGEKPSHKVHEDEDTYAFLDINPRNKGHTLVVPKKHRETFLDLEKKEINSLFQSVQKVAKAVKKATDAEGFNIIQNNKRAAGQIIDHVHVHIIPRHSEDNVELKSSYEPKEGEFKEIKEKIEEEL
ncbi:MAG: HIT family protein [archaeon]